MRQDARSTPGNTGVQHGSEPDIHKPYTPATDSSLGSDVRSKASEFLYLLALRLRFGL
jgi:hypothetical protein